MLLLCCFIMASLSCVASGTALWLSFHARKQLRGASARSLMQLSTEVAELMSACESLAAQQRRLSSRVGMREARQRGEDQREEAADAPKNGVGTKLMPREKLKEIARARGFDVS